jgi:hypothetical protein
VGHPTVTHEYKLIYVGYITVGSVDEVYLCFDLPKNVDIFDLALETKICASPLYKGSVCSQFM